MPTRLSLCLSVISSVSHSVCLPGACLFACLSVGLSFSLSGTLSVMNLPLAFQHGQYDITKICILPSYLELSQMLLKGCWLPDDQGGNSCSSAKCKFQAVRSPPYYFCCCNTDLCNHSIPPPIKGEWKILIQLLYITSKAQQMQRKLLFQGTRDSVMVSALVFGLNKSRAFS